MAAPMAPASQPTEWVMVPVPHQYQDDVRHFVMSLALQDNMSGWTAEALRSHLGNLGEQARTLVHLVAEAIVHEPAHGLRDEDAAAQLGLSVRELFGVVQEINEPDPSLRLPGIVFPRRVTVDDVERRFLYEVPDVAEMVRSLHDDPGT